MAGKRETPDRAPPPSVIVLPMGNFQNIIPKGAPKSLTGSLSGSLSERHGNLTGAVM